MTWAKSFLQPDARPGMLMLLAALLALVAANTPVSPLYDALKETPVSVRVGSLLIDKPLLLWINDGLMALFFFLVGLEIKRETVAGELSTPSKAALPAAAAVGGMFVPALVYAVLNWGDPLRITGWAIPAATDIAFALGVLALLGSRVPPALRILLLGVAIYDDLGAILVIAFFYTADLAVESLLVGAVGLATLLVFNRLRVRAAVPYLLVGAVIWVAVLKSGVHATLAGFLIALFIPMTAKDGSRPLERLEHGLHPWVAYFVIPVFAFANAGVALVGVDSEAAFGTVTLGIALGLFAGKQIGVMAFAWAAVRIGLCRLPTGVTWLHLYGVALLTGIGFTMSLFIGSLAFTDDAFVAPIRIGVLMGSTLSAVVGVAVLALATRSAQPREDRPRDVHAEAVGGNP